VNIVAIFFPMLKPVAVAAQRNAFANLFLYPAPSVTVINHAGDIVILVAYVVEL